MNKKMNHCKFKENEGKLTVGAKELYFKIKEQSLNINEASITITTDTALLNDKTKQYFDELKEYNIIKDYYVRQVLDDENSMFEFVIL